MQPAKDVVRRASNAMSRRAAMCPNHPPESTHHWCPPLIRGAFAGLTLSHVQLQSTCECRFLISCEFFVCFNSIRLVVRLVPPPDTVSAWLSQVHCLTFAHAHLFCLNCVGLSTRGRVCCRTQMVHLWVVSHT